MSCTQNVSINKVLIALFYFMSTSLLATSEIAPSSEQFKESYIYIQREVRQALKDVGHENPEAVRILISDLPNEKINYSNDFNQQIVLSTNLLNNPTYFKYLIYQQAICQTNKHYYKSLPFLASHLTSVAILLNTHWQMIISHTITEEIRLTNFTFIGTMLLTAYLESRMTKTWALEAELGAFEALYKKNEHAVLQTMFSAFSSNEFYGAIPHNRPSDVTVAVYMSKLLIMLENGSKSAYKELTNEYFWKILFNRDPYSVEDVIFAKTALSNYQQKYVQAAWNEENQ